MNAVVVYESLWGNTAAVAQAIAEGIGSDTKACSTGEATPELIADADLIVAGSPVFGFRLPTESMRVRAAADAAEKAPRPADLSHPSLRSWLDALAPGHGRAAAFETRIWWSPRGATGSIEAKLRKAGYTPIDKGHRFVVEGTYGPLREGELAKARAWGSELAHRMESEAQRQAA
jgi:hypothetical protein